MAPRRRRGPLGVDQDEDRGRARLRRPDRRGPQHPLRRARARHGRDRQRHGVPRRRPAVRRHVLLLLGLHAAVGAPRGAEPAARRSSSGRTTRSASAKTARRTRPVEHLMSLRAMPDFSIIRPATPTRRPRRGAPPWSTATEPWGSCSPARSFRSSTARGAKGDVSRGALHSRRGLGRQAEAHPHRRPARELQLAVGGAAEARGGGHSRRASSRCRAGSSSTTSPASTATRSCRRAFGARLSIEAGVTLGWQKYVGDQGGSIGVDRYGASAPGEVVMREYGFTVDHVVEFARGLLRKEGGDS